MPTRRQYAGGATAQTLAAPLTSIATTATITDNAGWPTSGPFAVVLDRGTATEEKILVASQAASTLTIQTRGYDGSGAWAHAAGTCTAELCVTAIDLDEANAHTSASAGVHGVSSSVVGTSDAQTLANKTLTQPIITDLSGMTHDHTSAAQGGSVAAITTPGQAGVLVHTGSVSGSPGNTFSIITHGAPFTPTCGFAYIAAASPGGNYSGDVYAINASNFTVAFRPQGAAVNATLTTVTVTYVLFG